MRPLVRLSWEIFGPAQGFLLLQVSFSCYSCFLCSCEEKLLFDFSREPSKAHPYQMSGVSCSPVKSESGSSPGSCCGYDSLISTGWLKFKWETLFYYQQQLFPHILVQSFSGYSRLVSPCQQLTVSSSRSSWDLLQTQSRKTLSARCILRSVDSCVCVCGVWH